MKFADKNYPWTILILDNDSTRSQQVCEKIIQIWPKCKVEIKDHQDLNINWGTIEAVVSFSEFESIANWVKRTTLIPVLTYSDLASLDLSQLVIKKSCFCPFETAFSALLNSSFSISFT